VPQREECERGEQRGEQRGNAAHAPDIDDGPGQILGAGLRVQAHANAFAGVGGRAGPQNDAREHAARLGVELLKRFRGNDAAVTDAVVAADCRHDGVTNHAEQPGALCAREVQRVAEMSVQ
jgi:hypothetical protein